MDFRVLTLQSSGEWTKAWQQLPPVCQDVYLRPEYLALYENENTQAQCALLQDGKQIVLYPFLKTALRRDDCYDIEGAYGYNAAVSNSSDEDWAKAFAGHFLEYCREQRVVAEFMRVNPMLQDNCVLGHLELKCVNKNVVVDLRLSEEKLWQDSYEHCVRKNIKKAQDHGLQVRFYWGKELPVRRLSQFVEIYAHTMDRRESGKEYHFSPDYFGRVAKDLPYNSIFVYADTAQGQAVSCELVLVSATAAYSFLGGTLQEFNEQRPNNLLKNELIRFLKAQGLEWYCLGGGRTPDDGIYRYKKTFARQGERDFFIGTRVHDQQRYDDLCRQWQKQFPEKEKVFGHFFLKYKT